MIFSLIARKAISHRCTRIKEDGYRRIPASWPRFLEGQSLMARERARRLRPSKNAHGFAERLAKRAGQDAWDDRIKTPSIIHVYPCVSVV
jgi:hypothetical protein